MRQERDGFRAARELLEEAEPLFHQAWRIWEEAFGPHHPKIADALYGLAILYYEQGKYEEAEPLFHQARRAWERALGLHHPRVGVALARNGSV